MGFFRGGDRNGDGYVSPFDADETQDYVDPAKALDREAKRQAKAEDRRRRLEAHNDAQVAAARRAADRARREDTTSRGAAPTQGTPAQRHQPAQPQETRPQKARTQETQTRPDDDGSAQQPWKATTPSTSAPSERIRMASADDDSTTRSTTDGNASGYLPNGLASAAFVLAIVAWSVKGGPSLLHFLVIIATILFGLLALLRSLRNPKVGGRIRAVVAIVAGTALAISWGLSAATLMKAGYNPFNFSIRINTSSSEPSSSESPSSDDGDPSEPAVDDDPQVMQGSGVVAAASDKEKADVTIVSARRGPDTYDHRKTVIVTYRMTNQSSDTVRFYDFGYAVYQHGMGLSHTTVGDYTKVTDADQDGLDYYDFRSESADVASGSSADVTIAFELRDDSDIVAEVGSHYSGQYVRQGFSFASGDEMTAIPYSDAQGALKGETAADDGDMFHTWSAYKSGASSLAMAMKVTGVEYEGKDYNGRDYAIVTVQWINQSKHPFSFERLGVFKVTQNGTELSTTVPNSNDENPSDAVRTFDSSSGYDNATPGTLMTVTKAYILTSTTDKVQVTLDVNRAPSFDQSFDLTGAPAK